MQQFSTLCWRLFLTMTAAVVVCWQHNDTLRDFVGDALAVPDVGSPGDDPPFYFIRQDFVNGVCAGVAEILALVLAAMTWKRFRQESIVILWFTWLWLGTSIADAVIISWRCSDLMDVQRATSGWATHQEYLNDPVRRIAYWASLSFAMLLVVVMTPGQHLHEPLIGVPSKTSP